MNSIEEMIATLGASDMGAPVYKRSTKGAIQVWRVEREHNKFRTIHGQLEGAKVTSEWTECQGKNLGKANETSPTEQAIAEVIALYKKKTTQGKYTYDIDGMDAAAATYLSPMLAQAFTPKKMVYPAVIQPKLDGVRCIVNKDGMWSRKGKPFPACMHIHEQLEKFFQENPEVSLDGELYNHALKEEFEELISLIKQQKPTADDLVNASTMVEFHVYDVVGLGDNDYEDRFSFLHDHFHGVSTKDRNFRSIELVDGWDIYNKPATNKRPADEPEKYIQKKFENFLEQGYEGAIIRLRNMPYEQKRTYQLQKYKNFIDEEFEVVDILEGKGNWAGHAKIAALKMADGTLFNAGIKGNKTYAKKLLENKHEVIGQMATVTYFRLTAYGIPYLPIFKVIRNYE